MTRTARRRSLLLVILVFLGWAALPPEDGPFVAPAYRDVPAVALPAQRPVQEVLLLGDTGAPQRDPLEPTLRLLQHRMRTAFGHGTAVFLGDNVYPAGIPAAGAPGATAAMERLAIQLDAVRTLPGRVLFVPGNHDWNDGAPGGAQAVARQRALVTEALGDGSFPVPAGRPGPAVVRLAPGLTLLALDTAWFLYESGGEQPGREQAEAAFARALHDTLAAHAGEQLIVAGHHPLFSNGQHSGRYPFRSHIYPLTELRDWAYVPLPVVGTLAFEYVERNGLSSQDLGHPRYRALRRLLVEAFAPYPHLIYAAGHDHGLQYFPFDNAGQPQHAVVSGGGARTKIEEVVPGHGMAFGYAHVGIAHLRFYADGRAFLDLVIPKNGGNDAEVVFRTRIR